MEFWGVEVPAGNPLTCDPGVQTYVHISQAALGESKNVKGNERVVLKVNVGNKEVVVGTLSQGRCDQTTLDLIFHCKFRLSHNSTSSSVYFSGYKTDAVPTEQNFTSDEESEEEEVPKATLPVKENGKAGAKGLVEKEAGKEVKLDEGMAKPTARAALATKLDNSKDGGKTESPGSKSKAKGREVEDEEEVDDDDEMDDISDDYDDESDDEESEGEDEDESEDEPKSVGKKRPLDNIKSSSSEKKAKLGVTAAVGKPEVQKTDVKTPATPAPLAKQQSTAQNVKKDVSAKKISAKEVKGVKGELPTSGKKAGQYLCQPCNRNFTSESALSQHNLAKHGVK